MSEHKKLARTLARAFYRHSSTRERLARAGNAKHDNTAIVEVLVDALTRRAWVREDDLAASVLLSAKQVRKALHYLEEQKLVTRAHVKEKDKERIARTRLRAEEQKVDDHVLNDRLNSVEKKVVTYVRLDYSRVVDAATLRIGTARRNLRRNIERGPASVLYRCVSEDDVCGKRYTSLDAARLLGAFYAQSMTFRCQVCRCEVVQLGGGEDGAPPEPKTKEGMKKALADFEREVSIVQKQLDRVKGKTPPQYGTLNEWTRAMKIRAARAGDADGHHHHGGGGGRGGLGVQTDDLEDTKFEVTLGLTKEQEEAMEAEANAPKAQPEWLRRNQARSPHTGSRTTASAWCTPILKEFVSRRLFLSAHPSLTIPTHLDAFQLRF
ncbi:uncharacterized protein MICPUCDRAFT_52835 [Micromonas pusilla CCMP1545]|uniref:Predicted protein n=1 Tax=Micromonas pusilla (strain CCMP1545) TaxID=564608 RepID=C1N577_MICPC|nr:uncharacterized protein MICPUCDRAFT_52835 [Micromonas pusilla CCMP1545]EEH53060.1 predicted protein [Micromonas pusilla CCMP1545]|eukprot:XP_003063121.1 predicted protein [Micromonas pusilla CCMP1545]